MSIGPKSVRGKVTLIASLATAMAMALIVAVTAFAMNRILTETISDSLDERLAKAQSEVQLGNYQAAIDLVGGDMMQVLDADGNIVAQTPNTRDVSMVSLVDGEDERRVDEIELEVASSNTEDSQAENTTYDQPGRSVENQGGSKGSDDDDSDDDNEGDVDDGMDDAGTAVEPDDDDDDADDAAIVSKSDDDADEPDDAGEAEEAGSADDDDADEAGDADDDDSTGEVEHDVEGARANAGTANAADARNAAGVQADVKNDDAEEAGDGASDDDADDEGDDESDEDESDSDDDDKSAARASISRHIGAAFEPFLRAHVKLAYAATTASDSQAYVDASRALGDDGPYLIKKRQVESPDGTMTLIAVTSLAPALRTAQTAAKVLAAILLAVLLLVIFFTWRLTARTLQPVEDMRRTAESISASNLSARIPVPEQDEDLSRLAVTLNDLLARVESSMMEQRRFVSDASHELKSPIAAMGIMLETMRMHPDAVDNEQAIQDLTTENNRLQSIVGDLLMLARADENRLEVNAKPLDMMDLLSDEVASLRARSSVDVDASGVEPVVCEGDAALLSHALRNVLDNAARYARSTIKLSCRQEENCIRITVSDDGPGLELADRERVFDRFARLGADKNDSSGTGLGLPVARGIAERHGGSLRFEDPEIGGATAVLELPASQ